MCYICQNWFEEEISMKKILLGALVGVLVVAAVGAVFFLRGGFPASGIAAVKLENHTVVDVAILQEQILSIGELATVEYDYTNVITMKESLKVKNWKVPGTQKSFIVSYDGTMKLGIDTAGIVVDASEDSQNIIITVPKAKILSHAIHEKTLKVLDQKSGLFNTVQIEDYAKLATAQKQAMEDKVAKGELLARAESDAVKMLQSLMAGIVPAGYTVEVAVSATP
jgi:hypothetical protein